MLTRIAVSSADFIRNIGYWQTEALRRPVAITHHGRERLVLASPEEFRTASDADANVKAELGALRMVHSALTESIEEGFIIFDAELRVRVVNHVAEAFFGRSRLELEATALLETLPELFGSILQERLRRVLRSRKPETFESGGGDGWYLLIRIFPLSDGAMVLFGNLSEQHRLRREQEESQALWAAMRRHTGAAAIRLDLRGRFESVDQNFCRILGFTAGDVTGHRLVELLPTAQRVEAANALERVLRDSVTESVSLTLISKPGREVAADLALAPILADRIPRGAQGVCLVENAPFETPH